MFRKMRRFKQQLPNDEMLELLENGKTAILGVLGDEGYPYTVPVNYVYSNGKIYIHGAKAGHKIDSIKNHDKVSLCIIGKDDVVKEKLTTYFKSVIVFGRARILEKDEEIFFSAESLSLKYNEDKEFVDNEIRREWNILCCIEVDIEHMTGKEAIELTKTSQTKTLSLQSIKLKNLLIRKRFVPTVIISDGIGKGLSYTL